ncbi:unnamed protein product [Peronospora belbahrii]|uniref:Uncharacterized protein n=1 Tax=Peronospora belbahrii TaxID=622444 RepID=A0AAU9KMF9_9STRA|nr:unnamed protein product [Peronospora belbahrii]CAH0518624.1 unnamed protein product [Peronospora belbahrii]
MAPTMVTLGIELLKGGEPPESFLEGLIIPLRKRGDSHDAMEFHRITPLQLDTKYSRKQSLRECRASWTNHWSYATSFVDGRQMLKKIVIMMLTIRATAKAEPGWQHCRVGRSYCSAFGKRTTQKYGDFLFWPCALRVLFWLREYDLENHDCTTAQCVVDEELSESQASDIRNTTRLRSCTVAFPSMLP